MSGYLKFVEGYGGFEYPSERDEKAAELIKEGKLVLCSHDEFGYFAVFVYEVSDSK